jgi:dolichol-phosphate mannosyltransferase
MSETPSHSVIIATRDDEDSIAEVIERSFAALPTTIEVLVVDGGHDHTEAVVARLQARHPGLRYIRNQPDLGKGHAIRVGIAGARAPLMAQIDSDLQFLPEELPRLFEPLERDRADVALGSRFTASSSRADRSVPGIRSLGNRVASAYASILFGHRMTDVQAGMKAWTREAITRAPPVSNNYSYEAEIPCKAHRAQLRVVDVPVSTLARMKGETKVNVVRDGLRLLVDITRFRLRLE